jgi:hypothetical protein
MNKMEVRIEMKELNTNKRVMKTIIYTTLLMVLFYSCVSKNKSIFNEDTQNYYSIEFIIKDTISESFGGKMFIVYASDTNWIEMAQFGEDLLCKNNSLISRVDFYTDSTKSPKYGENYEMPKIRFDATYFTSLDDSDIVKLLEDGVNLEDVYPVYRRLAYDKYDKILEPIERKCEIDRHKIAEMVTYRKNYSEIVKMLDSIGMKVLGYIESENYEELKRYALDEDYDFSSIGYIKKEINKIVNSKGKVKVVDFYNQDRYNYKKTHYIRSYTNEEVDIMVNVEFNPHVDMNKFVKIFIEKQAVDMNDKEWQDYFEKE